MHHRATNTVSQVGKKLVSIYHQLYFHNARQIYIHLHELQQHDPQYTDNKLTRKNWTQTNYCKVHTSANANLVRIPSQYPESVWLLIFNGDFLVKFARKSNQFFQIYEPNCGKMLELTTLKNSSKNSWLRIPNWLTVKTDSLSPVHICDKNFHQDPISMVFPKSC